MAGQDGGFGRWLGQIPEADGVVIAAGSQRLAVKGEGYLIGLVVVKVHNTKLHIL